MRTSVLEVEDILESPEGYPSLKRPKVMSPPEVETYSETARREWGPAGGLPLFEIEVGGQRLKLSRPILLRTGFEGQLFFAENETLGIFGSGKSLREAVREFRQDLSYYISYYRNLSSDQVAGDGRNLKEIYAVLAP